MINIPQVSFIEPLSFLSSVDSKDLRGIIIYTFWPTTGWVLVLTKPLFIIICVWTSKSDEWCLADIDVALWYWLLQMTCNVTNAGLVFGIYTLPYLGRDFGIDNSLSVLRVLACQLRSAGINHVYNNLILSYFVNSWHLPILASISQKFWY